jgi:hypothetical protein
MPTYLDFDSTKRFRDFILGKTLNQPNGPQTYTSGNYSIQNLSDTANIELGSVDDNRQTQLTQVSNGNVYKPLEYSVREELNTLPRRANLSLYPYFEIQDHTLIGVFNQNNLDRESELMRFAGRYLSSSDGPVLSRVAQNISASTNGRVRLLDALNGNTATASNIITGREPLVEPNNKITVAKTLPGKVIDFVQVAAGLTLPWSEIPGDYLTDPRNPINIRPVANTELGKVFQDATGALGSLLGIQRRPQLSRKPSDLLIEYMGDGQKSVLYDNLSYSKYAPNYTTTARSQNSSKIFNFVDQAAQGVKNLLGVEAPRGVAYIGDDRGNDVKYAMNDFNDRTVRSNYYLSLMFDPVQAELFQRKLNVSEGGGLGGKLTWISSKSKNKLGVNNKEWDSQQTEISDSLSNNFSFREDSILGYTQEILETLPTDGGASRSHVANVIDQTSRVFREGDVLMSRGSAVKYTDKFTGEESGVEFCRVWTKDRSYFNYSDTMKRTGNIRKFDGSVMSTPWNLNIAPMSNGQRDFAGSTNMAKGVDGFYAKKYMFSIENLAWKSSNTPGFTVNDLPYCERGPNGGRVMWFPPYDLKVSEQNNARWESNTFLGRPEPIYTYQNTERSGQISFKVVVDHPSILNLLVKEHFKGMSDEEADNYINAFFAGCEELDFYDLIRRYSTITADDAKLIKEYLEKKTDTELIKKYRIETDELVEPQPVPKPEPKPQLPLEINLSLNFANDNPDQRSTKTTATSKYETYYNVIHNEHYTGTTINQLDEVLRELYTGTTSNSKAAKNDKNVLHGKPTITSSEAEQFITTIKNDLQKEFNEAFSGYTEYSTKLGTLKNDISGGTVGDITVGILSSTSAVADNGYNYKLSLRRSHSIVLDIVDKLKNGGANPTIKWPTTVSGSKSTTSEVEVEVSFKDLGYTEREGKIIFKTLSAGEEYVNERNQNCGKQNFQFVYNGKTLKDVAPVAFGCRQSSVRIKYTPKLNKQTDEKPTPIEGTPTRTRLVPDGTIESTPKRKRIPIDPIKRIIMKTLSECYYFQKLEESDPVVFKSLKEKLKYFHPGFHSTTPEGLNARLTFVQQCIRPGDTIPIKGISDEKDLNARNTTFGPPPICVLRVGDFYHSKIIIRDVNITFDDATWDLNPEGIGVQPMIANVSLQINFIGGQGLEKPIERLQNALSSNFYANTEMYDERSISSNGLLGGVSPEYTKEFLEEILKPRQDAPDSENKTDGNELSKGTYIGVLTDSFLDYTELIKSSYTLTENYFIQYDELYNNIVTKYGPIVSSMFLHPTYRTINNFDVYNSLLGSPTPIQLFGEYRKGRELSVLQRHFKSSITDTIENSNLCEIFGFDKELTQPKINKANELLNPYVKKLIGSKIDESSNLLTNSDFEKTRNEIIDIFDRTNFLIKYGYDSKLEGEMIMKSSLSGYTSNMIYDEIESNIEYITNNTEKMYEDLDDTSINFFSPTINTSVLTEVLSVLLKDDMKLIMNDVFGVDKTIFDEKTIKKLEKRFEKFITTVDTKKFKFKKFKGRKNDTKVTFKINVTEENTETNGSVDDIKKILSPKVNISNDKLNFYKIKK